jgi:hypothetical protein
MIRSVSEVFFVVLCAVVIFAIGKCFVLLLVTEEVMK